MSKKTDHQNSPRSSKVSDALEANRQASESVQRAADELAVVHSVLDKEVPKKVLSEDVDEAVERAGAIEKKLSKSSKKLQESSQTLKRELG